LNVDWLSHLPAPARRSLYFGLQRAIGSRVRSAWRQFQQWARFRPDQLEAAVGSQLGALLDASVARSAYYRSLGLSRGPAEPAFEFLRRFPVLSRKLVRDRFTDLVVDERSAEVTSPQSVASRRYDWVVVKTGGTTGLPTSVVHDASMRDWGRAARLFAAQQCGYPLGTPYFRLWGAEQDLLNTELKLPLRVQRALLGEIPMNAFRVNPDELRRHHATLLSHPEVTSLMAYVDSAVSLADFIRRHNLPRPRLRTIMACAGTVTDQWRQLLQETFGAEVFDKYGSRDCAEIACECAAHAGLHVYSPTVFVEVVDESGQSCPPGRTGRVLITLLRNGLFPMIRYDIGDLAQWAEPGACSCGLAWPRLKHLEGRADDMLMLADGTRLSSAFIRHFVGVSLNRQLIDQWQFEQAELGRFIFRYVPAARTGLAENVVKIKDGFHLVLGRAVTIELREVAEIPPSPTGKVRWIINRTSRS
jgi:phenylacetate-CoA ligase